MKMLILRIGVPFAIIYVALAAQPVIAQKGACCPGDASCIDTTQSACDLASGDFLGEGSTCATTSCFGACCLDESQCVPSQRRLCSGTYQGPNTTCALDCPAKLSAHFTYQGQLKQTGVPLDGTADLEFSLWTTPRGGDQVGSTQFLENVSVVDGLFSVSLNFLASSFRGDVRWLEIAVRSPHDSTDTVPLTALTARQPVRATPYALQTRGLVVDGLGNLAIGTDIPFHQLHVVSDHGRAIHALTTDSGESAIHGQAGHLTNDSVGVFGLGRGANGRGVVGLAERFSGTNYGVRGETNSATGYAGYFEGGRNYFEGFVGIGTVDPQSELHVVHPAIGSKWAVRVQNSSRSQNECGMRVSDGGFFDVTNTANTPSPSFARLNSTGNWTVVSDRRLKRNIKPLTGILDKAVKLQPVSFRFKNDAAIAGESEIGFIAQEVHKQFPSLVTQGELLTLNYAGLSVVAIAAIQEQHRIIADMTKENAKRASEMKQLKARMKRLEALLAADE